MGKKSLIGYALIVFGMFLMVSHAITYLGRLSGTLDVAWLPQTQGGIGVIIFVMGLYSLYAFKMGKTQVQKK